MHVLMLGQPFEINANKHIHLWKKTTDKSVGNYCSRDLITGLYGWSGLALIILRTNKSFLIVTTCVGKMFNLLLFISVHYGVDAG